MDDDLSADTGTFAGAGDRAVVAAVRAASYRRDPRSVTQRASHAATERCVSLRPCPGPRHTIDYRTPTGHTYRSTAPPLPGTSTTERLERAS